MTAPEPLPAATPPLCPTAQAAFDAEFAAELAADAAAPPVVDAAVTAATLVPLVDAMLHLKEMLETVEEDKRQLNLRYDDIRKRLLPEAMQAAGLVGPDGKGAFTHASGAKVHLRAEIYANVAKANEQAFFTWLRENGHGGLIKETVPAQTVKAFARELLEEGQPLPPVLATHLETVAVVTNRRKGAQE